MKSAGGGKISTCADFVIVGAGTAGAAAAKLLSRHYSVILLEKGINSDSDQLISDPLASGVLARAYINKYFAPFGHAQLTDTGRLFPVVTGLLDGGSSSVNGMQVVRGTEPYFQKIYDVTGKSQWKPSNVFKTYREMENFNGTANPIAHGLGGPVDIRQATDNVPASELFAQSVSNVTGLPYNIDYNNITKPNGSFVEYQLFQTPEKNRESSSTAYLSNLSSCDRCGDVYEQKTRCGDLTLYHKATVDKVLFEYDDKCCKNVARKVKACVNGSEIIFTAKKCIIISAGFWSSTILQRSGVGEKAFLKDNCIKVIYDNPNVGKNLQNHTLITLTGVGAIPGVVTDPQALYTGGAFVPDPSLMGSVDRAIQYIGISSPGAYTVIGIPLNPKSTGTLNIYNSDPTKMGNYVFNYFDDPADMLTAIAMVKQMSEFLVDMGLTPTETFNNDAEVEEYILTSYGQTFHWAGTCSMGKSHHNSVINGNFKVHGVEGLYVADDSIYPTVPDGNTAYPAFLAGNLIAKLLSEKYSCGCKIKSKVFVSDKKKQKDYVKCNIPKYFENKKLNCYLNTGCTRNTSNTQSKCPMSSIHKK
uniref:Flavin-containing amine oxidoreductase n=1 Tax=Pithovirus LCPAC101 TaxID=2506586 RepID=A0A481Z2L6_9VIRU|nr:MAG: flavin-containing amine oxidoreductase [Pithovirus LCPAC101]